MIRDLSKMVSLMRKHLSKDLKETRSETWVYLRDLCRQRGHARGETFRVHSWSTMSEGESSETLGGQILQDWVEHWKDFGSNCEWDGKKSSLWGCLSSPIFTWSHWLLGGEECIQGRGRASIERGYANPERDDNDLCNDSSREEGIWQILDISWN